MAYLHKRTSKGIDYWSLRETKRINGKPTPVVIENFGNAKAFAEKLMKSRNENKLLKSYSHGDTYALMKIAEVIGIESILDDAFKQQKRGGLTRSQSLLLVALQTACSPGSKSDLSEWLCTTTLPYERGIPAKDLSCDHFWKQMNDITESELANAEDALIRKIFSLYEFELEKIALDYTNYHTYIKSSNEKCYLAKRGRNKQKRNDLRQFSLAIVTTKESGLPIFTYIYEGNKNDQTAFAAYMLILEQRIPDYDPNTITLVFDGGGNNKENFKNIKTHYICSFSLSSCKNLYNIDLSEYEELILSSGKQVRCFRLSQEIWDDERECILTFSKSLYIGQLNELNANIESATSKLKEYNEQLVNPKSRIKKTVEAAGDKIKSILKKPHLSEIFEIRIIEDGTLKIEYLINARNKDQIAHQYFGKKLLISDRKDWSTAEILQTYRDQDCIEKIFRSTKDSERFSIRPQYHHTDQKIRVHVFCCLLGLTLATILHKEAKNRGFTGSRNKMLDILSGIRRCWIKDRDSNSATYVTEVMTEDELLLWNIIQDIK